MCLAILIVCRRCIYVAMYVVCMYMYVGMYVCSMHVYVCMHVCMYVVCMYMYVGMYVYRCVSGCTNCVYIFSANTSD